MTRRSRSFPPLNEADIRRLPMKVFYHPGYAAPIGEHIMPMRKFALVAEGLREAKDVQLVEPAPVTEEDLLRVHTAEYVAAIRGGEPRDLAESQKFPWSPQLYPSVCLTNGGCLAAARQALRDGVSAALVSGFHHACRGHGGGFCTFNGLIVALDALAAAGEIRLGAVLDMDLHYGNGTAELADGRAHVFALSIYGNDYGSRAGTPDPGGNSGRDGDNHRSFALPEGCNRATLLQVMDEALPLLAERRPDLLLYQAGADPYFEDPYSRLALNHDDLRARDLKVFAFARRHGIPIAWVLAGGYTKNVHKVIQVHLNTFEAWRKAYETGERNALRHGEQPTPRSANCMEAGASKRRPETGTPRGADA